MNLEKPASLENESVKRAILIILIIMLMGLFGFISIVANTTTNINRGSLDFLEKQPLEEFSLENIEYLQFLAIEIDQQIEIISSASKFGMLALILVLSAWLIDKTYRKWI